MARKISLDDTLTDAVSAATVWQQHPEFEMGEITFADFSRISEEARGLIAQYSRQKQKLLELKIRRDKKIRDLSNLVTRFRRGMYGYFGPDSIQYGEAGGTRSSERKPRRRTRRT